MKRLLTTAAALAVSAAVAAPASAQVNGIGVADPAVVIATSQALRNAYTQISTTFQAQRTQLEQLDQQRTALIKKFDTNNDGQISEAERTAAQAENNPTRKQLETLDQQINQVQTPITQARAYVVEQIAQQLNASVQQVVSQGKVQMILSPGQVLYMAPAADITDEIAGPLNTRLPQVSITPPANWQPAQQTVELFQDVQQVLLAAAVQQQQAAANQAQQPAAAAPAAATPPVKGR
jgi:Skp family chaperone for outer membrane proteins